MLISALIFGLLGSFHCVGMCGPIAFLLPVDRENKLRKFMQILLYHTGRITSYAIIGLAFGLIGKSLSLFGLQQQLSIIIGVLMLVSLLIPFRKFSSPISASIFRVFSGLKNSLAKELRKKRNDTFFSVGFLNGFLPCGLVYMAVFGAIASGNAFQGSLYMVLFGLGTVPLMTCAVLIGNFISVKLRHNIRKAVPVFLAVIAVMFIIRGLGLGIPYLSPKPYTQEVSANFECHTPNHITKN